MRALLPVLLLLVAGCAAPGGDDAAPAPDEPPTQRVIPWGLTECRYLVGWTEVDEAALAPYVPDGFTLSRAGLLPGGALARPYLGFEAFTCASGAGLDGIVEQMTYGSVFTEVEVPEPLQDDESLFYVLKWDVLVPDAPRRELMAAQGFGARDGTAFVLGGAAGTAEAQLALEEVGEFRMLFAPTQTVSSEGQGGPFKEFTPDAELARFATWRASYAWDEPTFRQGRGFVELSEGSWPAEVLGATRAPAAFHAGTWSFADATLTLPLD